MANEKLLIGQFILIRAAHPDTPDDPYDPTRESLLEDKRLLPNPDLVFSTPAQLPPPPVVDLSSPSAVPAPPPVNLSSPATLPPPPNVALSVPVQLPPPPAVAQTLPSPVPPPPAVPLTLPAQLPPPPTVAQTLPSPVPPPPAVTLSRPSLLPQPPAVQLSTPAKLPKPPDVRNKPSRGPDAPIPVDVVKSTPPPDHPAMPVTDISSGYLKPPGVYSPGGGGLGPGTLAADPVLYERQLERMARDPGKLAVHAATQAALFALNSNGKIWNPALVAPPPVLQNVLRPALDTVEHRDVVDALDTVKMQVSKLTIGQLLTINYNNPNGIDNSAYSKERISQREMVDDALFGQVSRDSSGAGATILVTDSNGLARFPSTSNGADKYASLMSPTRISTKLSSRDVLAKSAFADGIIPMRVSKENVLGFTKVSDGNKDLPDDDAVYVPLSFTDLRPIGNSYRTIYFRPIITSLAESLAPSWNKKQFFGRVDPVATYESTARTISMGLQLVAFGPEDVETIYKKLHWLSSLVYPEYDNDLMYKSGPMVRMRVGDVINAVGVNGIRGLPGIIESLDFDYTDSLWELKKNLKVPRKIDVSLTFTVLHDTPIGRGSEGKFGGLGEIDSSTGRLVLSQNGKDTSEKSPTVSADTFRKFGESALEYERFSDLINED